MAKKRKKSFKSLPTRAKRAAFAKMTANGTIRAKNKSGKRAKTGSFSASKFIKSNSKRGTSGVTKDHYILNSASESFWNSFQKLSPSEQNKVTSLNARFNKGISRKNLRTGHQKLKTNFTENISRYYPTKLGTSRKSR